MELIGWVGAGVGAGSAIFWWQKAQKKKEVEAVRALVETHWYGGGRAERDPWILMDRTSWFYNRMAPKYPFDRPEFEVPLSSRFSLAKTKTEKEQRLSAREPGWVRDVWTYGDYGERSERLVPTTAGQVALAVAHSRRARTEGSNVRWLLTEKQRLEIEQLDDDDGGGGGGGSTTARSTCAGHFEFGVDPEVVQSALYAVLGSLFEKSIKLLVVDARGASAADVAVGMANAATKSDCRPWTTLVTDCAVPGVEIAARLVAEGVKRVVLVGDDRRTKQTASELAAAAAKLERDATAAPEKREQTLRVERASNVNPTVLDETYPELVIRKISPDATNALLRDPDHLAAFVSSADCSFSMPKAPGGSYHIDVAAAMHGSQDAVRRTRDAMDELLDRLVKHGVKEVVFACDHSNSRGPYAAGAFRHATRRANERGMRLFIMYPGLGRAGIHVGLEDDGKAGEKAECDYDGRWSWNKKKSGDDNEN